MYSLKNDYSEGAHPRILETLLKTNLEQSTGYGEDSYSNEAKIFIRNRLGDENVDIHFISGGTQTNLTAIAAFLRPYEAAIAANTGHILVHETGAIEATGHKVISVPSIDGKLKREDILKVLNEHTDEHMVKPKLVYISNSTEVGTIYYKKELEDLSKVCRENDLLLFMDGARLGSALCSKGNDLKLSDFSELTDAFYIGGTKNGAFMGEALVICNNSLKKDFRFHIKQRGAMIAKGRFLGIQFLELFRDDLFFELAENANKMADILREGIKKLGYSFLVDSPSNQLFPVFPNSVVERLQEKYSFNIQEKIGDNNTSIRLVTSWATKEEDVVKFVEDLKNI
ncbi:aminotransferase class I/II-fold pyridoxal phosphate-dependent enzyme [Romboutsia weinsteinii]|uniref:Aminotransferase class I/II-fold pyridoxal phosphate-dependent enzyme n=1 Tax=Romboutsia weinsteinii TaxID=2020949 RepID=A0A371J5S2_9FIRM|nr:aminotransferase class I/II-fold pyridoxal phosphate-dependent enzyme [Romboutsia weinsteinii]RDY28027.1 aminotransferase class I/II-fold pyridoxal phosphate-dependent enzyme [Romboutsia weinsteinii]